MNSEIQKIDIFNGNVVLIPYLVYRKIGIIDNFFKHAYADIEYSLRAKKNGIIVISFTGFDGGRSRKLCDHSLHVDSYNYGVVENLHHAIMNITSQYIRNNILSDSQIKKIKF